MNNHLLELRAVNRLLYHSQLVQRIMFGVACHLKMNLREVLERAMSHDFSKFTEDMYEATLLYDIKDYHDRELDEKEEQQLVNWTVKHYNREKHHPGHFADCNEMRELDLLEMVSDWTAMGIELKNPDLSAKWFADKVIGHRFLFNQNKIKRIYELIQIADDVIREQKLENWFVS